MSALRSKRRGRDGSRPTCWSRGDGGLASKQLEVLSYMWGYPCGLRARRDGMDTRIAPSRFTGSRRTIYPPGLHLSRQSFRLNLRLCRSPLVRPESLLSSTVRRSAASTASCAFWASAVWLPRSQATTNHCFSCFRACCGLERDRRLTRSRAFFLLSPCFVFFRVFVIAFLARVIQLSVRRL